MKIYKILITKSAQKDIENIFDYIAFSLLSYDSAKKQINKIEKAICSLKTMPNRYKLFDEEPERSYGLHRMIVSNYMICFIVDDSKVTITNVLYARSNVHFHLLKSFK